LAEKENRTGLGYRINVGEKHQHWQRSFAVVDIFRQQHVFTLLYSIQTQTPLLVFSTNNSFLLQFTFNCCFYLYPIGVIPPKILSQKKTEPVWVRYQCW